MTNPFEALANAQMVAVTKAKHKAAEKRSQRPKIVKSERDAPMKLSDMEQKQADKATQTKMWRAFHRTEVEAVKHGRHADNWRELERVIRQLTIENPDALVKHVQAAQWLREADFQTRRVALSMISSAIIRVRLSNGYPPIDDSLPGEEPTAFEIIRKELRTET